MGADSKKRQKRLAKKKAKRKSSASRKNLTGDRSSISIAQKAPVHECFLGSNTFEIGIGLTMVSKKMPNMSIAAAIFLLDVYCLGVKDCYLKVFSRLDYAKFMDEFHRKDRFEAIHPSCTRKLVEQAVDYAKNIGIDPCNEYKSTKKIFGDINPEVCPREFTFGQNGKPFYVAGPNDSPDFSNKIMKKLLKNCGEDNFHYLIPVNKDGFDDNF
ncbi:hypothetical protein QUF76_15050 [Desulfobacterales bacterium HSG16]|nr:hypothetical protein [Desulfobacterales bacterium HSG16]